MWVFSLPGSFLLNTLLFVTSSDLVFPSVLEKNEKLADVDRQSKNALDG